MTVSPKIKPVDHAEVAALWPVAQPADHKYSRGVVGVIAGSDAYPGAAVLACSGAVRAGAGLVRHVGPDRVQDLVLGARPEVVPHSPGDALPRADAWVVGPGIGEDPLQERAAELARLTDSPRVVDAAQVILFALDRAGAAKAPDPTNVLFTPHAGELAEALNALGVKIDRAGVEAARHKSATRLADLAHATVLLKGHRTLVVSPGGRASELPAAPAWLATAGTGDVLAGIAGALLAAGLDAREAGISAALVHGLAAEHASAGAPIAALDVASAIPSTIGRLLVSLA